MAVDDILNRIRAEAEEAAGRVMSGAQNEAEEITEKVRKGVEAERERLLGRARQRADEERNRIVTMARLSARRELLEEKQRLIERVFEETRESILSMGRDEYRGLMRAFLDDTVDPGGAEVVIDVDEKRIDQPFLDQVSAELGRGALTLAKDRRVIGGGFVLRSGRTETNCTLETILRDARERLEPDVAAILFAAENKD
jgi:V/A-type H+-transporting ATPase subunit E